MPDLTPEQVFDRLHKLTYNYLKWFDDARKVAYTRRLSREFFSLKDALDNKDTKKKGFLYFGRLKTESTTLTKSQLPKKVEHLQQTLPVIREANTWKIDEDTWRLDVLDLAIKQLNSFNMQKLKLNQKIANCSALGYLGKTINTFPIRYASDPNPFYAKLLLVALVLTTKDINAELVKEFLNSIEIYQLHVADMDKLGNLDTTLLNSFKKVCEGHLFVNKHHNGKNQPLIERFTDYDPSMILDTAEERERKDQNEVDKTDDLEDIFENIFS